MPMGPITLSDVVGLDTSLYAGRVIHAAFPDRSVTSSLIGDLVGAGRMGQKSGAGFYSYAKGSRGIDDPALEPFLAKVRKEPRQHTQEELTERLFLPMVTEASRVLAEKIVRDPGDVDMGLILGTGFPPFRGGLLRWADSLGPSRVVELLRKYESLGPRYRPTELLTTLAATNGRFYAS
jgi:3-hydroxyacyl-CoA dehydrogenase/enoyl-CoA hydratase/3-hydroxybutyryl-CoA epimerase/3-hydroxyacyl-CoA dehydrogenase/enoyl-CoA hydratase/3-hydroxybutyryl-CoA epimerase/enoyl-CoA isomerase